MLFRKIIKILIYPFKVILDAFKRVLCALFKIDNTKRFDIWYDNIKELRTENFNFDSKLECEGAIFHVTNNIKKNDVSCDSVIEKKRGRGRPRKEEKNG